MFFHYKHLLPLSCCFLTIGTSPRLPPCHSPSVLNTVIPLFISCGSVLFWPLCTLCCLKLQRKSKSCARPVFCTSYIYLLWCTLSVSLSLSHTHSSIPSQPILQLPTVKYGVRSPKFIWAPCAQQCSLAEIPQLPPPPAFGLIY